MAIFSRIRSAISRAFTPKSTGITPTSSSSRNAASAFSAISSLAGGSKVTPSTATVSRSSSGAQMSYAPQMTPLPTSATQTVNSILAGVTPQRTNAPQYSSAPQYTQDPTLPIYGSPVSISGGQRPSSSEMAMTSDPSIISTQSFAPSSNTSTSNFNAGGVTGTTTSSSAPSVGDAPTYSDPGLINNDALIKELSQYFDYDVNKRQFTPKQTAQNTQTDSIEETLRGFLPKKENLYEDSAIQNQQAEVQRRQQEVNAYTSQLNSIVAKQNADLLNLRGIGSQEGVTETVYGGQAATINREAAIKALPVQAQLASAQGNLQLAQDYLGQLTTWKKEEIQNNYDYKKGLYDLIRERVTGAEKRQLDKIEKDEARAYDTQKNNLDFVQSLATKAFEKGQREVASRLMALMQDPSNPNMLSKAQREFGKISMSDTSGYTAEQLADPFIKKIVSTSGGKPLTDTSIQKLDKGLTVLGQLGVLQSNIEGAKTGPILGAFRSANPWDTQAQTIKNQLNAIVPNLARGVYGEVGVLTDNDIATYSKTIPSLKSTEEVRNAVLYITLDMIGKSIKNTLSVNASAGRDVSGFVDIYTEMEGAKNSILQSIPSAQVPQAFSGTQTSTPTTGTTTPESLRSKYGY